MTKQDIKNHLNSHYQELQQIRRKKLKDKMLAAMENIEFANLEKRKRALEMEIAKAESFYHVSCVPQKNEYACIVAKINDLVKTTNLDLDEPFVCPHCQDTGWIGDKQCVCRQKLELSIIRQKCSLAPMPNFTFEDNQFASINTKQTKNMAQLYSYFERYCKNFDISTVRNFLFLGDVGIGKTSLACAIANRLLEQQHIVFYITAFDMNNLFLNKVLGKESENSWAYEYLFDCELLIIDDLGTEPILNRITLEYLFALIDSRINYKKHIIISSNLDTAKFQDRYGGRMYSRLTNKLYFVGTDYIVGDDLRKLNLSAQQKTSR